MGKPIRPSKPEQQRQKERFLTPGIIVALVLVVVLVLIIAWYVSTLAG